MKAMRQFMFTTILFIFIASIPAKAQVISILATENKTTSIIFPDNILHVDLGLKNDNIAIDVDKSVPKILKLRLSKMFLDVTNMLVVTQNDLVYSFEIRYSDTLNRYVYIIEATNAVNSHKQASPTKDTIVPDTLNKAQVLEAIHNNKENLMRSEIAKKGKTSLILRNIFVHNDDMYFLLELENKSNLKYTLDFLNLYMTSNLKKSLKGVTSQDIQVRFNYIEKEIQEIQAHSKETVILHVRKFTLEADKIGILEVYEKEGGRHLKIKIGNTELLSATKI